MEKKMLYIRLDSSPLPEESTNIIVKDFNLESYFCTLLGKMLLGKCSITQSVPFPGKMVSDFKNSSVKSYNAIIKQWELILVKLLSDNNKEEHFILKIPASYFEWLSRQEDKTYREIGKTQSDCFSFTKEFLYEELIDSILLKRLDRTLSKISETIDLIVIGLRYQQRLADERKWGDYVKTLNRQFEKSTIINRKDYVVRNRVGVETEELTNFLRRPIRIVQ